MKRFFANFSSGNDLAQSMRLQNAGPHLVMLIIEGMPQGSVQEEASREHDLRRLKIECLTRDSGYGITELDQLVEGFAQRLETQWIQKI